MHKEKHLYLLLLGIILHASIGMNVYSQHAVSGVVKDPAGEPIIGANIVEVGTTNGTITELYNSIEEAMLVTPDEISPNFVNFMLDERCREMLGKLNRWEDLVRTETLVERVKQYNPDAASNIKEYHKLRPIPQKHIDRISLMPPIEEAQNEGYYYCKSRPVVTIY